jgi:hypothetical protein
MELRTGKWSECLPKQLAAGSYPKMANPQLLMAGYGLEDRANVSLYGLLSKHKILYCVEVQ